MGLIKMAAGAVGSTMRDAVRDYFRCDGMTNEILCLPAAKVTRDGAVNQATERVISNGSVFDVAVNQAALLIENGRVHDYVLATGEETAGQYRYTTDTEPSLLGGGLKDFIPTLKTMGRRFTAGGQSTNTMNLVYVNLKEITQNPVGFGRTAFLDQYLGTRLMLSGYGYYTFRIANPIAFYENLVMDVNRRYDREALLPQLKQELQPQLMAAVGKISPLCTNGYQDIYLHQKDLADAANEALRESWLEQRGLLLVQISVTPQLSEEDTERVMQLENARTLGNTQMAMGTLVSAQAEAMREAGKNPGGAMNGFVGMGMAMQAGGIQTGTLLQQQMAMEQAQAQAAAAPTNSASINPAQQNAAQQNAAAAAPQGAATPQQNPAQETAPAVWTCSCGTQNTGKFCQECGAKRPEAIRGYCCAKCGWETADTGRPPKFCPQCGDPIEETDILR